MLLDKVVERDSNIDEHYIEADIEGKRKIIGSMYTKKMRFDGAGHRTACLNEALEHILLIISNLLGINKGKIHLI